MEQIREEEEEENVGEGETHLVMIRAVRMKNASFH